MKTRDTKRLWAFLLVLGMLLVAGPGPALVVAKEPQTRTSEQMEEQPLTTLQTIAPSLILPGGPGQTRTWEQMEEAEALLPAVPPDVVKPFMPTVDPAEYAAAKGAANAAGAFRPQRSAPADPAPFATPPETGSFEGQDSTQCGGCRPPDTHGAVGITQFVQVVNTTIRVYAKTTGAVLKTTSLQSFFGTTEFLFDPRVVFDLHWNRWVIVATRIASSPTDPNAHLWIAASRHADATGPFSVFSLPVFECCNGDWWDYPGLGFDQDAVIVTANLFTCTASPCTTPANNTFIGGRATSIAKARLYNNILPPHPLFMGLGPSPQPPQVRDQNNTAVIARVGVSPNVVLFRLSNGSNPTQATMTGPFMVDVGAYEVPPPSAGQFGTTDTLDTLDGRFQNAHPQFGNVLYQVHTETDGGLPTPRIYKIDWAANTLIFVDAVFRSTVSFDFNPSIGATGSDRAVVVWSATDPGAAVNAETRVSGKDVGDADFTSTSGILLSSSSSPTFYNPSADTVERWGDYSAVSTDPTNGKRFYVTNEKINSNTVWGSKIGHVTFP